MATRLDIEKDAQVNQQRFKNKLFERFKDEEYFLQYVCPEGYKKERGGRSEYFAAYGFDVPLSCANYYSKLNGIVSDKYMTSELYYHYVIPALNRLNFASAYTDKNIFSVLFPDIRQPETIVKNMNGVFYRPEGFVVDTDSAIECCLSEKSDCIIKPTVDSSEGRGVALLDRTSPKSLQEAFATYGVNFIVQRKLRQSRYMAILNPTSFNTIRIYTYRSVSGCVFIYKSFIRFGGAGDVRDNVSAGGGIVSLDDNGRASDRIFRLKNLTVGSLSSEKGIENFVVPDFGKIAKFAIDLHQRLPYFDFIGWDIGICEDGEPVFVEYNVRPFVEGPQMACGPMFGEFIDEVMDRVKNVRREERKYWVNVLKPGFEMSVLMGNSEI